MNGMILAAGRGSRLDFVTKSLPKILIRVDGVTLLERQITALIAHGVDRIVLVIGYRAQDVKDYINQRDFPVELIIVENTEWESTNNMFSFHLASDYLQDSSFVINGDICIDPIALSYFKNDNQSSVGILTGKYNEESMKVLLDGARVIFMSKDISQKESDIVSTDIFFFTMRDLEVLRELVRNYVEEVSVNDWFEKAISVGTTDAKIDLRITDLKNERWVEIDTKEDLMDADQIFFNKMEFLNYDNYYFDIDGTLLLDHEPINGARELLNLLSEKKKSIFAITNNTSLSEIEISHLFQRLDFPISPENIYTPIKSLEKFIRDLKYVAPLFLSELSLKLYFQGKGFDLETPEPDLIVISNDLSVTSKKVAEVANFVSKGIPYVLTHSDKVRPTTNGIYPDAGIWAIVIEEITGIKPLLTFGKPDLSIFEVLPPRKSLLIGDRYETDISLGKRAEISTALVLTGISNRHDYENGRYELDFLLNDFCGL